MSTELNRLERRIARLNNRMASTSHQGVIKEVKDDKIRVVMGKSQDGQEVLSPWLDTSNHRGGARERRFFKKGQNVTVDNPNGDWGDNATVSADSPNNEFKAPDHANDHKEGETYQLGELHKTNTKDTYDYFLQEEDEQNQQGQGGQGGQGGGSGQQQGQQSQGGQKKKPSMKMRMNKKGGLTGRVGDGDKAARFAATEKGAKLRIGDTWLCVTEGKIISSHPIQVGKDPLDNDNE